MEPIIDTNTIDPDAEIELLRQELAKAYEQYLQAETEYRASLLGSLGGQSVTPAQPEQLV
jgi:hypothetical protein